MIRLDTTTRKLQALLGGAITTNQLPVTVCYSDKTATAYTGGTTVINTNNTTAVDICAAPAASTVRDIDTINVNNADTVSATITIRYNDNGTTYTLFKATLATGDQLTYVHGVGWTVLDSTGKTKTSSGISGPSSSTDNAIVRWDGAAGAFVQDSGIAITDTGNLALAATARIYLDGVAATGDTYITETSANVLDLFVGGIKTLSINATGLTVLGTCSAGHVYRTIAYADADTTPSVLGASFMTVTNSGATTITNFDDGVEGQIITLYFTDANTTINRSNAYLSGGVNFVSTVHDTITLIKTGLYWFEVSRSVNS